MQLVGAWFEGLSLVGSHVREQRLVKPMMACQRTVFAVLQQTQQWSE